MFVSSFTCLYGFICYCLYCDYYCNVWWSETRPQNNYWHWRFCVFILSCCDHKTVHSWRHFRAKPRQERWRIPLVFLKAVTQKWERTDSSAQTDSGALIHCGISGDLWPGSLRALFMLVFVPAEKHVCYSVPTGSPGRVENYSSSFDFCLFHNIPHLDNC